MSPAPVLVLGYLRVSTGEQADSGLGLAAQERSVRAYCDLYGLTLSGVERDEGKSGKDMRRPAPIRALARARAKEVSGIVFAKLDRLSRNVRDIAEIMTACTKDGIALHSVGEKLDTSTGSGRLVVHVLAAVAEWERAAASERTAAALAALKAAGGRNGQPPWGYSYGPEPRDEKGNRSGRRPLVPNPGEQETALRAVDLSRGGAALRHVARALTKEGRATRKGGAWRAEQVRAVLKAAEGLGPAEAS